MSTVVVSSIDGARQCRTTLDLVLSMLFIKCSGIV